MKVAEVRKQINSGETGPLYLLEGDDLQSRHDLALEFAALVDEGLQAFNVQSFYANEATTVATRDQLLGDILAAARTLPMMAPRRVLILHEAERILSPKKGKDDEGEPEPAPAPVEKAGRKKARALSPVEQFEEYLQSPEPLTTLVMVAGQLDANRRLVKLTRKHAAVVECGVLETAADASRWAQTFLGKDGLSIEPQALTLVLRTTGLSLGAFRPEIEKLALYAAGEKVITARHVKDVVIPSETPTDGPAVGMAIKEGNAKRALDELAALFDGGAPHLPILGQIRWGAGQLRPEPRVKAALDRVLEIDLAIKSSAAEPRYLLERLVIELCTRR